MFILCVLYLFYVLYVFYVFILFYGLFKPSLVKSLYRTPENNKEVHVHYIGIKILKTLKKRKKHYLQSMCPSMLVKRVKQVITAMN